VPSLPSLPPGAETRDLEQELRAARQEVDNLRVALESNRRIGMAIGILVARRGLTEQKALDLLKVASQRLNRRVRDLAEEIIHVGDISSSPQSASSTR
jgi:AmiR/NasT family two-component response regulator